MLTTSNLNLPDNANHCNTAFPYHNRLHKSPRRTIAITIPSFTFAPCNARRRRGRHTFRPPHAMVMTHSEPQPRPMLLFIAPEALEGAASLVRATAARGSTQTDGLQVARPGWRRKGRETQAICGDGPLRLNWHSRGDTSRCTEFSPNRLQHGHRRCLPTPERPPEGPPCHAFIRIPHSGAS